jgi:hypothetical protein
MPPVIPTYKKNPSPRSLKYRTRLRGEFGYRCYKGALNYGFVCDKEDIEEKVAKFFGNDTHEPSLSMLPGEIIEPLKRSDPELLNDENLTALCEKTRKTFADTELETIAFANEAVCKDEAACKDKTNNNQ